LRPLTHRWLLHPTSTEHNFRSKRFTNTHIASLYNVYGEMNPLIQDLLKFAEADQEEFTKLHQEMKEVVARSLQRQAMKKGPQVTSNTISSCLEIESKRVYKRKKPLGERGNK
jgi:hypothetical protein